MSKKMLQNIVHSTQFNITLTAIILINAILIGIQTSLDIPVIDIIQQSILFVFIAEIIIRWAGKNSLEEYLRNPWNYFDIIIVCISLIPDSLVVNISSVSALRVLRILRTFRLLRLFKAFPELQTMVQVLIKGVVSLSFGAILLLVFMYMYSVFGVMLFQGESVVVTAFSDSIDPFGSVGEAFFTLFRVTTGEDWTDLRYDMLRGGVNHLIINFYFVSWYIVSAFLLVNIVFGAIISHYEQITQEEEKNGNKDILKKLDQLEKKINKLKRE